MTLNKIYFVIPFFSILIFIQSCQNPPPEKEIENSEYLFKQSSLKKQNFQISGKENKVIESEKGVVVFIPKGSFLDEFGNPFEGEIDIEFAEITTIDEMIRLGLETTSNNELLQSDGLFYINAFANGKKLIVNPENPIHIQIPTPEKMPNAMAYELSWDIDKKLNWMNPVELENYLIPVDLAFLDFLPIGFEHEVITQAPYSLEGLDTVRLVDSLYKNLAVFNYPNVYVEESETEFHEGFSNVKSKIKNGKYTPESFEHQSESDSLKGRKIKERHNLKRVSPASVSLLKDAIFQNTLISTYEFENRIPFIHLTCNQEVLDFYINNLDKNLWEIDKMVAKYLINNGDELGNEFSKFSDQKLTKIEGETIRSIQIKKHYERSLLKLNRELKRLQKERLAQNQKLDKITQEKGAEYKKLLWKREKYRMQKYNFKWSKTGWVGIGKIQMTKPVETAFQIIFDSTEIDESYIFVVIPEIKSLYKVNKWSGCLAVMIQGKPYAVGLAFQNNEVFYGRKPFSWDEGLVEIEIQNLTSKAYSDSLKVFNSYHSFNQIKVDLDYNRFFYKEQKRQKRLKEDSHFQAKLREKAFPCLANDAELGEYLFNSQCSSCHNPNLVNDMTGPALAGIHERRTQKWLIRFTKNSQKMIGEGEPWAMRLWNEWNSIMTSYEHLSDSEIKAIYEYIKIASKNKSIESD